MADPNPNRPVQPNDLLNMAITAQVESGTVPSGTTNPVNEMDAERRRWLEEAMSSAFGAKDIAKEIQKHLELLSDPNVNEKLILDSLEQVKEYTEHIDFSNDFHKVGGFPVLRNLLNDSRPAVRSSAAELLSQLLQNNPYCQEMALQEDLFPLMLSIMEKDSNQEVRNKILGAVSSLVRSNADAQTKFTKLDGLSALVRSLTSTDDVKFQTRAAFMLNSICADNKAIATELGDMGLTHHFVKLLQHEHSQLHEQVLEAMLQVLRNSDVAKEEAKQQQMNLVKILNDLKVNLEDRIRFREELQHIDDIQSLLS